MGDYRVIGIVGSGAAGEVYKVEHAITRRVEAMKVLLSDRPDLHEQSQRFLREIQVQASLSHPNIASVLTAFRAGNELMMVMELVDGKTLDQILEAGRIPLPQAIDFAKQALSALVCAHTRNITHRDIKPSNMIVNRAGVLKLTDFGLARTVADTRVTNTGAVVGSLHYISPEQVKSEEGLDHRTDIYSMGAVLYELVTGFKPFPSDNAFSLMMAHVQEQPAPPSTLDASLPPGLSDLILKAMAKKPDDRFQTAAEFLQALDRIQPDAAPAHVQSRFRLTHLLLAAAICTSLLIAAVLRTTEYFETRIAKVPVLPLTAPKPPGVPATDERVGPPKEIIEVEVTAAGSKAPAKPAENAPQPAAVVHPQPATAPKLEPGTIAVSGPVSTPPADGKLNAAGLRVVGSLPAGKVASAITISPSGRWIAAGTVQGSIELMDTRSPRRWTLSGHSGRVTSVAFSRDGEHLASASVDGSAKIWDLNEHRDKNTYGHTSAVQAVAFAGDGSFLATGSADKKVRLWSLREKGVVTELPDVRREPSGLLLSPAGDLVAALSSDKTLRLWSVRDVKRQLKMQGPESGSSLGAFSPDGRYFAAAGANEIRIMDVSSGATVRTHKLQARPFALAFTADGGCLALYQAPDGVKVMDAWEGQVIRSSVRDRTIIHAAFRPDGRELAVAGDGGIIGTLHELPSGTRPPAREARK